MELESMRFEHALPKLTSSSEMNLNTFQNKREYEASKNLVETRSENQKPFKKIKEIKTIWDKEPIDFSVKLYHPKPPKRNSKDAIKPWTYDKYLKPIDPELVAKNNDDSSKKSVEKVILNNLFTPPQSTVSEFENEFQRSFRVLTPNGARVDASKNMSYRDGLDQFKNPKSFDHRGLKPLYGAPDFRTRFEKDPFNIKFLSSSLNQIHGLMSEGSLREEDTGLQMGDLVKKADLRYDPKLILPRLPFPNKFNSYTRFRRRDRSVESAFWDRVLPTIHKKQSEENFVDSKNSLMTKSVVKESSSNFDL